VFRLSFLRLSTLAVGFIASANLSSAAGFTAGNIVAVRVGYTTSTTTLTTAAAPVFLDEYNPVSSNSLVQRIDLTNATATPFTVSGTAAQFDGTIHVSADNKYLVVGGYACAVGTATPYTQDCSAINRVIAKIKLSDGSIDMSTKITSSGVTGLLRAVTSTNGTDFWVAMNQTVAPNFSTIYYTNPSLAGNAIDVLQPVTDFHSGSTTYSTRDVLTYNNNLYCVLGNISAGRINGLYQVGSGFPTNANNSLTTVTAGLYSQTITLSMVQTAIESYTPNVSGGRFFAADAVAARSLIRWTYNGTSWTEGDQFGGATLAAIGCALGKDPSNNDVVFYTQGTGNPNNKLWMADRNTGAATEIAQGLATPTSQVYSLLRGLAFVPPAQAEVNGWSMY
jgi:hypothetical protein